MAMKEKFFIILPYLVLTVIISLIVDYFWKVSGSEKIFHLEGIKSTELNKAIKEELDKGNPFIYMHQINVINQDSDEINFAIWSKKELKAFRLLDFKILYEDNEIKIKRNILYELKDDNPNSFRIINKESSSMENLIYQYNVYGGFENFKICKVNFKKIFSKRRMNLGDKISVKIIIHYLLDNNEYFQELNFVCECVEGNSYPPNWFMFFFPGAY